MFGGHSKFFPKPFDYFTAVLRLCSAKICGRIILSVCVRERERERERERDSFLLEMWGQLKRMFCPVKFCATIEMITSENVSSLLDCYSVCLDR